MLGRLGVARRRDGSQHRDGARAILEAGNMHGQSDKMTGRTGDDGPLAAPIFLPATQPPGPPLRGFDRLAIDPAREGTGLSPGPLATRQNCNPLK